MNHENLYELLGDINEVYVQEAGAYRRGKQPLAWRRWVAGAACLCLVAAGAFAVPALRNVYGGGALHPNHTAAGDTVQPQDGSDAVPVGENPPLFVNAVEDLVSADMDVQHSYYDNLSPSEWEAALEGFQTAFGFSYEDFAGRIPDTFAQTSFYSVDIPAGDGGGNYIPHDYVSLCQTQSGGAVRIALCPEEEPLRDFYIHCDQAKASEINGVDILLYGYQDSLLAQFSYGGIYYDIETTHVALEDLEGLLTAVLEGA